MLLEPFARAIIPATRGGRITQSTFDDHPHIRSWGTVCSEFASLTEEPALATLAGVSRLTEKAYTMNISDALAGRDTLLFSQVLAFTREHYEGRLDIMRRDGAATLAFVLDALGEKRCLAFGRSPTLFGWYVLSFPMNREHPWGVGVQILAHATQ